MSSIPGLGGIYVQPGVFSRVRSLQKATAISGGLKILSLVGEGRREEVIVESAKGDGTDGFNPDFQSVSDGYGRYFRFSQYPMIENRSTLYLNGSPLRILEQAVDATTFPATYDARIDPATGKIEMQRASLVDLGYTDVNGSTYYQPSTSNTGDGYLNALTLVDTNAPAETWTIRCVSTLLDSYGAPIRDEASFTATGSVSGQLKNQYGQPFIWKSNCNVVNNGVLSFSICNPSPNAILTKGDRFSVKVQSRVLQKQDQLAARYIAEIDLNNPETFDDPNELFKKHGQPSLENALSIGAQLAFSNGAASVLTVQAKPPLPRRTSEVVLPAYNAVTASGGAAGTSTQEDLIFAITAPGKPDVDTEVHFFVLSSDGTEQQIFPNKVEFYDPTITANFSAYELNPANTLLWNTFTDPTNSGIAFSYTIVSNSKIEQSSNDGALSPIGIGTTATFTSTNISFDASSVGKYLDFHNTLAGNVGRFIITTVNNSNSAVVLRSSGTFVSETNVQWQLLPDPLLSSEVSQRILFTSDLALAVKQGLRITYIDQKDSNFFDPNWLDALDVLETQDVQIVSPLPMQTISAIQQSFRVHVEKMSSIYYKRERVLLTGAIPGLTTSNVLGKTLAAVEDVGILEGIQGDSVEEVLAGNIEDLSNYSVVNNFGTTFRVMYFYPDEIIMVVNGENTLMPGYFISAAAGGWFAGQANPALPITMKTLVGFTVSNSKVYKQDTLNQLGAAGITVVQPIPGAVRVLHGKTTVQSGLPEEEEISIIFIRDQLSRAMRQALLAFVGVNEDPTLLASITAKVLGVLNSLVSQNMLTDYRNVSVRRDLVEPRQWNVSAEVQAAYPVNWVWADMSVGLF